MSRHLILVLQNKILRGEAPEVRVASDRARVFDVTEGWRMSPIVCSWEASTVDVQCGPVHEGMADQFELVVNEEAAAELVMALAARIAFNGVTAARKGSDPK